MSNHVPIKNKFCVHDTLAIFYKLIYEIKIHTRNLLITKIMNHIYTIETNDDTIYYIW